MGLEPLDVTVPSALTPQQRNYFETFGFLVLPGLLLDDIDRICEGFDDVFASRPVSEYRHALHFHDLRELVCPAFIDSSEKLSWLRADPRITGIVTSLIEGEHEYRESDGNRFSCDTGWHSDIFRATMDRLHLKIYLYLDPLRGETGALRMMPGTNTSSGSYGPTVRGQLWEVDGPGEKFGIDPREIPSYTIETEPGDVIVGDFRTLHATFGGKPGRRLITVNFCASPT